MVSLGLPKPKVYKKVDGNPSEVSRIESSPELAKNLHDTREPSPMFSSSKKISSCLQSKLQVIFPIIFASLCRKIMSTLYSLGITGDHVIGPASEPPLPSSWTTQLAPAYFKSLLKTEKVKTEKVKNRKNHQLIQDRENLCRTFPNTLSS